MLRLSVAERRATRKPTDRDAIVADFEIAMGIGIQRSSTPKTMAEQQNLITGGSGWR